MRDMSLLHVQCVIASSIVTYMEVQPGHRSILSHTRLFNLSPHHVPLVRGYIHHLLSRIISSDHAISSMQHHILSPLLSSFLITPTLAHNIIPTLLSLSFSLTSPLSTYRMTPSSYAHLNPLLSTLSLLSLLFASPSSFLLILSSSIIPSNSPYDFFTSSQASGTGLIITVIGFPSPVPAPTVALAPRPATLFPARLPTTCGPSISLATRLAYALLDRGTGSSSSSRASARRSL